MPIPSNSCRKHYNNKLKAPNLGSCANPINPLLNTIKKSPDGGLICMRNKSENPTEVGFMNQNLKTV